MWIEIPSDEANNKLAKLVMLAEYSIYVNVLYASKLGFTSLLSLDKHLSSITLL